jgi:hypothetical protein
MEKQQRIVASVAGLDFHVKFENLEKLPDRHKRIFIEGIADVVAALEKMRYVLPVMIPATGPAPLPNSDAVKVLIDDRVAVLEALGLDVEAELEAARVRFKERYDENLTVQAVLFLSGAF